MTRVAIALGSNLGDRRRLLTEAIEALERIGRLVAVSPLYETAPVGGPEQGPYLNAVAVIDTDVQPEPLLDSLHEIEQQAARRREVRWGPRTLDLDIILYGSTVVDGERLTIPHPRYGERRFVLEPLLAAWPDATDPAGRDLGAALGAVCDQDLTRVADAGWHDGTGRGAGWVGAQVLLLVGAAVATLLDSGSVPIDPVVGWVIGGVLLAAGIALGLGGAWALGHNLTPYPEPVANGTLVRGGVYSLVRHPLYGAVALVVLGLAVGARSVLGVAAGVGIVIFFYAKSSHEEQRLERVYPDYADYRTATPRRIVPWLL